MGRLFVIVVLALTGFWAVSASSSGAGARTITTSQTPARALANYDAKLERDRLAAEAAERRRRYLAGEMSAAERAQYEAEQEAERRRQEAERARAAAAAAAARSVRGTRVSGGGPSSGK
ncbi:hypothetical protein B1759_13280 [Rubrivirga sp. SAORIC476]|uniref:hypothetical protein n=1 Tax=Rubrivirga sp. SAORIC476 TaxID=1961794 RepID=UPI000BA9B600|nr:hypothetical protein [Rubrivirga sp. SAORIC476]MAQ92449.1 hypothetical protein [Rhodothermaceae bacterium]MBC13818.1 hypothetical protein [Rhodothermaceae bacterium]PAP79308.1 hypothetical protein B1759_13280 [Rubrivirga sp. SAORIC476]